MKFVYYKSLYWLGLNYKFIPFMAGFIAFAFNVVISNSDVSYMFDNWFSSTRSSE